MTDHKSQQPELSPLYTVVIDVENAISRVVYNYISDEDYLKITSIEESQLVYWSELIQRVHSCGAKASKESKNGMMRLSQHTRSKTIMGSVHHCAAWSRHVLTLSTQPVKLWNQLPLNSTSSTLP